MEAYRYKAFISYTHADEKVAAWLQRRLETWRPVRGSGIEARPAPVFRDREGLVASSDLSASIREALDASEFLVVVCSRAAADSLWVAQEVETFLRAGRRDRILCLIVGDPKASALDCLPAPLRREPGFEPLAADLRSGQDGRQLALEKLVAALVGVELETLRRREAQRRQRRMIAITAASLGSTVVLAALTLAAVVARDDAEQARTEADLRRQQAEALVGFMLGDLREKLEGVGRLDIMRDVGREAAEYFSAVPAGMLEDAELHQRATAVRQFGADRFAEGELEEAMELFQRARDLDAELFARDPGSREWGMALALSHYWIGAAHYRNDALAEALRAFAAQRDVVARVAEAHAHDAELRSNLAFVRNNIGMIQRELGQLEDALASLTAARTTLVAVAAERADAGDQRNAIDVSTTVGELQWRIDQVGKAAVTLDGALERARALLEEASNDALLLSSTVALMAYRGLVHAAMDDGGAVPLARERLELARRHLAIDETVELSRFELAFAEQALGRVLADAGDTEEALAILADAHERLAALAAGLPGDALTARDLARAELDLADVRLRSGRGEGTADLVATARRRLDEADGDAVEPSRASVRLRALAGLHEGRAGLRSGQSEEAREIWRSALSGLEGLGATRDAEILVLRAQLSTLLGEEDLARENTEALMARGWARSAILPEYLRPEAVALTGR